MKITYQLNDKLRLKVTDVCNMNCSFCHFEGSRGAKDLKIDNRNLGILSRLRKDFSAIHITGGEPLLYPQLSSLLKILYSLNYKVSLTTNGYYSSKYVDILQTLDSINFSLHSLNEKYLSSSVNDVEKYKECVLKNILLLKEKTKISVNTVATSSPYQHIEDVVRFCFENNIVINILQELNHNILFSFKENLKKCGFVEVEKKYIYPGSNVRTIFQNSNGNVIVFKEIEHFSPSFLCGDCALINKCDEGFSFIRLEDDPMKVRMCINHEAITFECFMNRYYRQLRSLYGGFNEIKLQKERSN